MDSYSQTFFVTFKSEVTARSARLLIAPLYHDLRAAFSTRMDDNNANGLRVAEVMAKHGQKGTFYLNDPRFWWEDNAYSGALMSGNPAVEIPKHLLKSGHSIGGHTLSHDYLPALAKSCAFREIMGIRALLEVQTASPIISFTYPFMFFQSRLGDGSDRRDLEEILRRSGYYQLAEHNYNENRDSGLQDGLFITCDGADWGDRPTESILPKASGKEAPPLFLVAMHPWVKHWGGEGFPKLAELYRKWSRRKDWWYCNQNQYAAYRHQALHSHLETIVSGNVLKVVLTRPDPLDLNDWIPLTLTMNGVHKSDVLSVKCPGAKVERVALGKTYAFDLFHGRERGRIGAFFEISNPGNSDRFDEDSDVAEGLQALLYRKGHILTLSLRNDGKRALRDIRVVFRLPLRWENGLIRKQVGCLECGKSVILEVHLSARADAAHYSVGMEYDVAQVDFQARHRVRLYASCEAPGGEPAAYFARDGFWVLGPLPGDMDDLDPQVFAKSFPREERGDREHTVPWGRSLVWKKLEPSEVSFLDPDIIPTTGRSNTPSFYQWHSSSHFPHTKIHYILHGGILSPRKQTVRAIFCRDSVRRLSLNGRMVEDGVLTLDKGRNDLRILYSPKMASESQFNVNNYGCYFRLTDAGGKRIEDIRFEKPPGP